MRYTIFLALILIISISCNNTNETKKAETTNVVNNTPGSDFNKEGTDKLLTLIKTYYGLKVLEAAIAKQKDDDEAIWKSSLNETAADIVLQVKNKAADDMLKVKREAQSAIDAAHAARDQTVKDLKNVEERYEVKMKDSLVALENKLNAEKTAALAMLRQELQALINAANAERDEYLVLYTKENKMRKAVHNKLLELQGNIRVICRVRPVLEVERKAGAGEEVDVTDIVSDEDIMIQKDPQTKARYEYDRVFSPVSQQLEVFDAVQPLCVSVLDGYNVCIFACK